MVYISFSKAATISSRVRPQRPERSIEKDTSQVIKLLDMPARQSGDVPGIKHRKRGGGVVQTLKKSL